MNLATNWGKETQKIARKKYRITLSEEEQQQLDDLPRKGNAKAREFKTRPNMAVG
jgi:hypothetical protein